MFTLYVIFAIAVYSTNPEGSPPFQRATATLSEFDEATCRARMTHILLNPRSVVRITNNDQPITWAKVTVLAGWRCVPLTVVDEEP